jgi:dTDP-4-amino-4,6-dideoxygalactose transaminase
MMIPISSIQLGPDVEASVLEVLRSGMIAQGPKVAEFEQRFAELTGVSHAIAMNNGTTTLVAALQALNLEPGDEVITSPFTFVATLNAILEAGATAVFVDINADDFTINPAAVEAAITQRTRVIMPVHLYGQMSDMDPLVALAKKHELRIIEDSAQSHGATYNGKQSGSFDIGSFSFYATKNLTTGEGGILTTNDDSVADTLRVLRNQGMRQRYQYDMAGHNYRMTDLQAAVVIPQLARYQENVTRRKENAAFYESRLGDLDALITPVTKEGRSHVWHQYTLKVTEHSRINREELAAELAKSEIGSGFYYPKLVFDYDTYRSRPDVIVHDVDIARQVVEQVISIPVHPGVSDSDRDVVASVISTAVRNGN